MFYNKNKNYGTKYLFQLLFDNNFNKYLRYFVFNIFINCYILYNKKKLCIF